MKKNDNRRQTKIVFVVVGFCRHLKHKKAVEVQWKEQCGQLLQPEYFQQSPTGSMAQDGTQVPARKSIFVC